MIVLFHSEQCKYCVKLLEYINMHNLKKYFKIINVDTTSKIPDNITIVPTIIDSTIEAPLEGKHALEYLFNQKYFNHPTNNIEFWLNMDVPIPSIDEDTKATDNFKLTNYACLNDDANAQNNVVIIKNKIKSNNEPTKTVQPVANKKTMALLKLRRT